MLKNYTRTVTLNPLSDSKLSIEDNWDFEKSAVNTDVILNFLTCIKPSIKNNIFQLGNLGSFRFSDASVTIDEIKIEDERLLKSWEHSIYRIRFTANKKCFYLKSLF